MHGVIAQPRGIGRSQTTFARARLDAAIHGIPREDRIGCGVPAHQLHLDVIRGQTTHPDANRRETETDAIAIGHLRTARVKRAVRGVETIALAPAQIVVQPRARKLAPDLEIDLLVILAQPSHVAVAPPAEPLEKIGDPWRDARASGCYGQRPSSGRSIRRLRFGRSGSSGSDVGSIRDSKLAVDRVAGLTQVVTMPPIRSSASTVYRNASTNVRGVDGGVAVIAMDAIVDRDAPIDRSGGVDRLSRDRWRPYRATRPSPSTIVDSRSTRARRSR